MSETATAAKIVGTAWIAFDPDHEKSADYWCEGEACTIQVERTDRNEIAVHGLLDPDGSADCTLYMTDSEATRLMMTLGRAILDG